MRLGTSIRRRHPLPGPCPRATWGMSSSRHRFGRLDLSTPQLIEKGTRYWATSALGGVLHVPMDSLIECCGSVELVMLMPGSVHARAIPGERSTQRHMTHNPGFEGRGRDDPTHHRAGDPGTRHVLAGKEEAWNRGSSAQGVREEPPGTRLQAIHSTVNRAGKGHRRQGCRYFAGHDHWRERRKVACELGEQPLLDQALERGVVRRPVAEARLRPWGKHRPVRPRDEVALEDEYLVAHAGQCACAGESADARANDNDVEFQTSIFVSQDSRPIE
jgi:hypothetical protein